MKVARLSSLGLATTADERLLDVICSRLDTIRERLEIKRDAEHDRSHSTSKMLGDLDLISYHLKKILIDSGTGSLHPFTHSSDTKASRSCGPS